MADGGSVSEKDLRTRCRPRTYFNGISGVKYDFIGLVVFFLLWVVGGTLFLMQPGYGHFRGFLPLPALQALWDASLELRFWESVWASLKRVFWGIFIASGIGIPAGLIIGFYPVLKRISYTPMQFLRMISPLSWMPVALIVFSSFESAVCFLIIMATVWPIAFNTSAGVAAVESRLIHMALNQGASDIQLLYTVILPACLPNIMISLRLALGVAWIVLVPAEFLGVASGLGYLINDARDTMAYDRLMAMIIAIGIIGFVLDKCLQQSRKFFQKVWLG